MVVVFFVFFVKYIEYKKNIFDRRDVGPSGTPEATVDIARTEKHPRRPWFIIHLQQMVKTGTVCEVEIKYNGKINTAETLGFFKSEYLDSEGRKQ